MQDEGKLGQRELALRSGFNGVEVKPKQRLLGVGEVKEVGW